MKRGKKDVNSVSLAIAPMWEHKDKFTVKHIRLGSSVRTQREVKTIVQSAHISLGSSVRTQREVRQLYGKYILVLAPMWEHRQGEIKTVVQ